MLTVDELQPYLDREKTAREQVPPEHQERLNELRQQIHKALQKAYEANLAGEARRSQAVGNIDYSKVLPVVEEYCKRYKVTDAEVRQLITNFAIAVAALKLFLESTNALDETAAGDAGIVINPKEIAGVEFSPILTIEDFDRLEEVLKRLEKTPGDLSENFPLLQQLYASIIDFFRRENEEDFEIEGLTIRRIFSALQLCKRLYAAAKKNLKTKPYPKI